MRTIIFQSTTSKVKRLSIQKPPPRLVIRWTTLKGLAAIILFLIVGVLIEYFVVLYAINLGVKDTALLQWSFQFPGTNWIITIAISPLFHLVPIAVIIALLFSWTYLTRHVAVKTHQTWKGKAGAPVKRGKEPRLNRYIGKIRSGLLRIKGIAFVWQKIHFARATIKSALNVLLVFITFIAIFSLFTYPQLIYQMVTNAYRSNPSFLSFVKGISQALAPISTPIDNALLSIAPGFRDFALSFGAIIKPLASLDNFGKYLVFQNVAAWIAAIAVLFYGEYRRKVYRYRKK